MSGGSLNYVYSQVEDAAREIARRAETPLHRAFAAHVMKVATALHDLEWLFSCDYSDGMEVAAIKAVVTPDAVLESATARAQAALDELTAALAATEREMANPQAIAGLNFSHGWQGHKFGDKWRIEQWIGDQWVRATWIDSPVLTKFFDDMANDGYQTIAGSEQHEPPPATHKA